MAAADAHDPVVLETDPWPNWDELQIGYVMSRDRWARGLGCEAGQAWLHLALTHLPHNHLIAVIHPANASSITLAQRLGFTFNRHDVTHVARR